MNRPSPTTEAEFWSRFVRTASGCLEWVGGHTSMGYGAVLWEGKNWRVHRLAWTLAFGPIPEGMLVCHRCDNPPCSEPTHLSLGTQADNVADAFAKGRRTTPDPRAARPREMARNRQRRCRQRSPQDIHKVANDDRA